MTETSIVITWTPAPRIGFKVGETEVLCFFFILLHCDREDRLKLFIMDCGEDSSTNEQGAKDMLLTRGRSRSQKSLQAYPLGFRSSSSVKHPKHKLQD